MSIIVRDTRRTAGEGSDLFTPRKESPSYIVQKTDYALELVWTPWRTENVLSGSSGSHGKEYEDVLWDQTTRHKCQKTLIYRTVPAPTGDRISAISPPGSHFTDKFQLRYCCIHSLYAKKYMKIRYWRWFIIIILSMLTQWSLINLEKVRAWFLGKWLKWPSALRTELHRLDL